MEAWIREAARRYAARDYDGAFAALDKVEATEENHLDLAYFLGLCHARRGDWDEALLYLEQHTNLEATAGRAEGLSLERMARLVGALGDPQHAYPVIHLMDSQRDLADKGATMRLGAYPCKLAPGSFAHKAYQVEEISERHRHRYEVHNEYRRKLSSALY